MPSLTVAVVSRNEAALLDDCLASVSGADEILVLDMESSDATVDVAHKFGARVLPVPLVPIAERVRQRAHDAAGTDWLLWLDPDERCPGPLDVVLGPHLAGPEAGFWVPFSDVAFGIPVPAWSAGAAKIALVRPGMARFRADAGAHGQPDVNGPIGTLVDAIPPFTHLSLRTVDGAVEKLTRYAASGGAVQSATDPSDPLLLTKFLWRSIVVRRAWRDGTAGTAAAGLAAIGDYLAALHRWEADGFPNRQVSPATGRALDAVKRLRDVAAPAVRRLRR